MTKRSTLIEQFMTSMASMKRAMTSSTSGSHSEFSPAQNEVLWHLSKQTDMSVKELAAVLRITPSAVTQLTEPLVKKGVLLRNTDPDDRRSVMLHVSPAGKKKCLAMSKERAALLAKMLEPLSDDELETLQRLFAKIANNKIKGETRG